MRFYRLFGDKKYRHCVIKEGEGGAKALLADGDFIGLFGDEKRQALLDVLFDG